MGKKKKAAEDKYDCWYCKRDFDDEATLVRHQRQKHFRCNDCGKQLYTINGLVAHAMTVHKTTISKVPNAVPERDSIAVNVVGLEGYPDQGDDNADAKKPKVEAAATPAQPPIIAAPQYPYPYPFPGAPPPFPPNAAYPPYYNMPGAPPVFPGQPRPGPVAPLIPHMPQMPRAGPFPPPPLLPMGRPPMPMAMPMPQPFPHNPALVPPNAPPHLQQATIPPASASASAPATTATTATAPAPAMRLVYDDEKYSMEEKRASLARYAFDSEANHAQQLLMDRSIDSRLASLR